MATSGTYTNWTHTSGGASVTIGGSWSVSVSRPVTSNTATVTVTGTFSHISGDWCGYYLVVNGNEVKSENADNSHAHSAGGSTSLSYSYTETVGDGSGSLTGTVRLRAKADGVTSNSNSASFSVSYGSKTTYIISYNANGGNGAPASQTKYYGTTLTLKSDTPTRTGYTFNGWNTNSSGTGTNYSAGGSYTANSAATLYAKWTAKTYTISYNANGGSGAPSSQTKTYGVTLTLSSTKPTRSGYAFKGWATSSSGSVAYNAGGSYTANAAATLYAVWQAQVSSITSASDTTIGNAPSIKWTPNDSSLKFKIKYSIGSWSYETGQISPNSTSAYTYSGYSLPMTVCNQLPNSTTGTMTITLTTYSGSTSLGSNSKTITVTVPSSVIPSISSQTVSEGTASGFNNKYVQSLSTVKAVIQTAGSYGSTVSNATMAITGENTVKGTVSNNTCTLTSGTLKSYGNKTITISVTDSRGRTASINTNIYVYQYFSPSASITINTSGTTVTITATGKIAPVGNSNAKTIKITRKKISTGTSENILQETELDDYDYTEEISETVPDVETESYQYTVTIKDAKKTVTASKSTGIITLSLLAGGGGAAFFDEATSSDAGSLRINGTLNVNGVVNVSNIGNIGKAAALSYTVIATL